jgi:predicted nucleic acid-binding protein
VTAALTCDASVLVAMLVDGGPTGQWATNTLSAASDLLAPHLALFEAANILCRHQLAELITADQAAQAHADLLELSIDLWPYEVLAPRTWQLRRNLSVYDGSYVALAEMTGTPLATLDARLARAPGVACEITRPPPSAALRPEQAINLGSHR